MHLVTIDIVILIAIAVLIIGVHLGLLISTYIFAEPLEKSKAKKPITVSVNGGEEFYKCPNCEGVLNCNYKFWGYEYCHKCGQRLDFKGVNENGTSKIK
jgi:hypothetical protein